MNTDPTKIKVERFLRLLERDLQHISVSDRTDILQSVQKRIDEELTTKGPSRILLILRQMGPTHTLARQELKNRNLPPPPAQKSILRWLIVSMIGFVLITTLVVALAMWKFRPLIEFDDKSGNVSFFGGAFDLSDLGQSTFQFQATDWDENGTPITVSRFSGERDFKGVSVEKVVFQAANLKLELSTSEAQTLRWTCQGKDLTSTPTMVRQQDRYIFELTGASLVKCQVRAPQGVPLEVAAENLMLNTVRLLTPLKVQADNGKVSIIPPARDIYRYNLSVGNGKVGEFASSTQADAYEINIQLENGIIEKELSPEDE